MNEQPILTRLYKAERRITDLYKRLEKVKDSVIEEAPYDGEQYARQDGAWTEITGGGGGSQDLQSVLENGATSQDIYIEIYDGDERIEYGGSVIISYEPHEEFGEVSTSILLGNRNASGGATYSFDPENPEGSYRIPTKDNITLQTVVDNNASASIDDGSSYIILFEGEENNRSFEIGVQNEVTGTSGLISLGQQYSRIIQNSENFSGIIGIGYDLSFGTDFGEIYLHQSKINDDAPESKTLVKFSTPIENTKLLFPAKSEGTYTLATESDISGTFANPTSITVVNGIITAIS